MAERLFTEKVKNGHIDSELYRKTAGDLLEAMYEGLGGSSFAIDDSRNTLKAYLEQNLYAFSAAKSITELQHFNLLLSKSGGDFIQFRNAVADAGYRFNLRYLKTEHQAAIAGAQMAHQWDTLTEHNEYLEFSTVGDDRVRESHAKLDGLTLHRYSPVWRRLWPPLEWGCRCTVVPGIAAKASTDQAAGPMVKSVVTNPQFDFNAGISKTIFTENHPYFEVAGKVSAFDAAKNYGLPAVDKLYDNHQFPGTKITLSPPAYKAWWARQTKLPGGDDIVLADKTGTLVLFDSVDTPGSNGKPYSYFKDHILRKQQEGRWQYATNFPDIITDPDEIWSARENKMVRYYIKYYEDAPYVVVAGDKGGIITAETMYQLTPGRATELRRGALLYTKK